MKLEKHLSLTKESQKGELLKDSVLDNSSVKKVYAL